MTMKKALLATFSFGYTDAAVIFSENQFSYERQNITGWRIRSTSTGTGTTNSTTHDELWRIQNISFHTDRDCSPKSKVDLSNAVLFSSTNGNNHHDTAWDIPLLTDQNESWDIGYDSGREVSTQCIRINLDSTGIPISQFEEKEFKQTITIDAMISPRGEWRSWQHSSWKQILDVRGLTTGTNILNLSSYCQGPAVWWRDGTCHDSLNTTECEYDGGDCNYQMTDEVENSYRVAWTYGILLAIIIVTIWICSRISLNLSNPSPDQSGVSNLVSRLSSWSLPSVVDHRELRRDLISTNIIHKKALRTRIKSDTQENKDSGGSGDITVVLVGLPHEQPPSLPVSARESKSSFRDEEGGIIDIDTKHDIYVESLRSLRDSFKSVTITNEEKDYLHSPQTCTICCEDYQNGDEIAWSKNDNCHHAYHVDCISEWLMESDDCPLCREKYLLF